MPWVSRILDSHWLVLVLCLCEDNFGLQPIIFLIYDNIHGMSTWQVWILLAGIVENFLGITLEGRLGETYV